MKEIKFRCLARPSPRPSSSVFQVVVEYLMNGGTSASSPPNWGIFWWKCPMALRILTPRALMLVLGCHVRYAAPGKMLQSSIQTASAVIY